MLPDEEIKKSFNVNVHDGIIDTVFFAVFKPSDEELRQAELYRDAVFAAIQDALGSDPLDGIVDLAPLEHTSIAPPVYAGKIYVEVASHPRIRRVALVGTQLLYKTFAKFVLMASGKGDRVKVFNSHEEAVRWIEELSRA